MTDLLSICLIGLGSIGKRHVRNICSVCQRRGIRVEIDALRSRSIELDPSFATLIRNQYTDSSELPYYDMIYICNPSQKHYETLLQVKDKAKHIFIEKPLFVQPISDSALQMLNDDSKYYVACPIRHTKIFHFLDNFVATNRIICARAICSSYLPEWRPGQDYRMLYAAQAESGGVKLDLIHEFDYLFSLFGIPSRGFLSEKKCSPLEISSSDLVSFIGEYADKTIELHLDYFGRFPRRFIELYTPEDVVIADFIKSEVHYLKAGKTFSLFEERDAYCQREEEYFLEFANGHCKNINPIRYANKILSFLIRN